MSTDAAKANDLVTRAEYCVIAVAECFRGDGEIMANPIGTIPAIGGRLARASFEPDLVMTDGEALLIAGAYPISATDQPKVIEAWTPRIKARSAVSPLIFAGFTDIGALNQWVHVWAYKNMGERERLRASAMKPGQWPPPRGESVVLHKQTSTFAVPAKFSPLR